MDSMTKEQLFERVVRDRIDVAIKETGYSFSGLLRALDEEKGGAVAVARRFISPAWRQTFQDGLRELCAANLLRLSVEQTIIDFHERGYVFTASEAELARERLQLVQMVLQR